MLDFFGFIAGLIAMVTFAFLFFASLKETYFADAQKPPAKFADDEEVWGN